MSKPISHHALVQRCSRLRKRAELDRDMMEQWHAVSHLTAQTRDRWHEKAEQFRWLCQESEATNDILRQTVAGLKLDAARIHLEYDGRIKVLVSERDEWRSKAERTGDELATVRQERDSARAGEAEWHGHFDAACKRENILSAREKDQTEHLAHHHIEREALISERDELLHQVTQLGQSLTDAREYKDALERKNVSLQEDIRQMVARESKRKWWQWR